MNAALRPLFAWADDGGADAPCAEHRALPWHEGPGDRVVRLKNERIAAAEALGLRQIPLEGGHG